MIGRTIGHYEIIEKIGEGGMGAVYKAHDIHLDRSVALKVLTGEAVASPEGKRRFALEAKAASGLNHPNIVKIYDIDAADGVDFIAMEYVPGQTLAEMIPPGGMEPARAIQLGAQIADALATAHQSGIVHRDLKPSNIMVNAQGRVKVLDFGLAKLMEPVSGVGATQTAHTRAGVILGTVAYMPPEQAEGRPVDQRADIFSFGAVLYEMLSGVRPGHARTRQEPGRPLSIRCGTGSPCPSSGSDAEWAIRLHVSGGEFAEAVLPLAGYAGEG